jgi:hypothetical protein
VLVNTVACVLLQLCQGSYHCGQTAHPLASTVAHNHHTSHRRPHVAVVGNKRDLSHLRVVSQSAHEGFAKSHGASVYLVSAKSGDGVAMMFRSVVASITGIRVCGASLSCVRQGVNAACKKSTNVAQPSCIFLLHTVFIAHSFSSTSRLASSSNNDINSHTGGPSPYGRVNPVTQTANSNANRTGDQSRGRETVSRHDR